MQKYHVNVIYDVLWPAHVEDANFLVFQDGSVELSSISVPGTHTTSVCLSPTRHMFTARFLAKIERSSRTANGESIESAVSSSALGIC